ncbi:MAG: pentapeptide repeat-containing protein [Ktedonobacterales bacterium]
MSSLLGTSSESAASEPDVAIPSAMRQRYFHSLLTRMGEQHASPLADCRIDTLGELLWVLLLFGWSGGLARAAQLACLQAEWFFACRRTQPLGTRKAPCLRGVDLAACRLAGVDLAAADLRGANLRDANLENACLIDADLRHTRLDGAQLAGAHLAGATLISLEAAQGYCRERTRNLALQRAPYDEVKVRTRQELLWIMRANNWSGDSPYSKGAAKLSGINLAGAHLAGAMLKGADLTHANLVGTDLRGAKLASTSLRGADASDAMLCDADLVGADLSGAVLIGANLTRANLLSARMRRAQLQTAILAEASLELTDLRSADLANAELKGARLQAVNVNGETNVGGVKLDETTWVEQIQHLAELNLASIDWGGVSRLGDAQSLARARATKDDAELRTAYRRAIRAYYALAVALRTQGEVVAASNFRFREQVLRRELYRLEKHRAEWVLSYLLEWTAGYGERPLWTVRLYGATLAFFALLFYGASGIWGPHWLPWSFLFLSLTAFHGRGFFPGLIPGTDALADPITVLAAVEAVLGLVLEVLFVASFTRRFLTAT